MPLVLDPGLHTAAYLLAKRTKLGHLMSGCGLTAVLAWKGTLEPGQLPARLEAVREAARASSLEVEVESHPRLLALMDQPQLAVLLTARGGSQLAASDLAAVLQPLASWPHTGAIDLLLAPDSRRLEHPSASLEPEQRPLADLVPSGGERCPRLELRAGAFVRWRA